MGQAPRPTKQQDKCSRSPYAGSGHQATQSQSGDPSRTQGGAGVPTVTLRSLDRMSKRVAQVQGCAHAALALVRGHHLGLVHARALDRIRQGLHGQEAMGAQDQLPVGSSWAGV